MNCNLPIVDVIHDLNFEHYPEHLPFLVRKYYQKYFPQYAQTATRIATVSEYSKQDIHSIYGVPLEKIDVVYNGVSSSFEPLIAAEKTLIKQKYTYGCDYFVYAGTLHPRKNIENLSNKIEQDVKNRENVLKLLLKELLVVVALNAANDLRQYHADGSIDAQLLAVLRDLAV